jgi:hypothetical protein
LADIELDVIQGFHDSLASIALDVGELVLPQRERIIVPRVEAVELINSVQHVADELLKEDAWGNADLSAERTGYCGGKSLNVRVVDSSRYPFSVVVMLDVNVTNPDAEFDKPVVVEPDKAKLHGAGVVETGFGFEIGRHSLGERSETLHPLGAVKESGSPGDEEI